MTTSPKVKRGRPKKVIEPETEPKEFFLQLETGNQLYFGDGLSMVEALQNLEKPHKVVAKGTLSIQAGNKKRKMLLSVIDTKRLFFPLATVVIAKKLEFGLK